MFVFGLVRIEKTSRNQQIRKKARNYDLALGELMCAAEPQNTNKRPRKPVKVEQSACPITLAP